MAIQTMNVI